ncbi:MULTISPECIES: FAD-dependent oxidoreductase [unclassified Fusibacter]|uniref:FAD-dependent oxidoreductase n=1 Tax=unclassified Fusibacter TaxID=2624464 RepID=UPI00101370CF|nr:MULTISPECIES: FAD-dependent oxidoreductase [unclassified Fusibacter]MCK8058436.1 FAD-dependent oxidoreductase [Fusibacter sp. A2]NPE22796.1 FAD-dependent oxidoreductase [Fusibacter sp. A1]RXV60352.1 FAD-dependent oxidoreductase [Fusibacter sp. A1]
MNFYTEKKHNEKNKELPIYKNVDVLVVGSGPSGLAAAIASSRTGAKTMIVERYGCFGGVISQVGVEGFAWYRHTNTIEAGGIAFEFEERAKKIGGELKEVQSISQALDAEYFKIVADELIEEAGVLPLLHTMVVEAILENGVIKGVIAEGKSGRFAIMASRIIDCTGDGDVAAKAGAPFRKRDQLHSVTPLFNVKGVNKQKFQNYIENDLKPTYADWKGEWEMSTNGKEDHLFSPYLVKPFTQAIADGYLVADDMIDYGGSYSSVTDEGDVTQLNVVFIRGVDCTDVEELTRAEITGRKAVLNAIRVMNKYVPGFEHAKLRNFGMTLGTRESRQIEGHYSMTGDDVMNQARFEDSIGIFPEFIDGNGILWIPTTGRYYQIPLRALLPYKVKNLLVAGRAISGDIMAHASFRNMSCCVVTGQGAGVVAALSIRDNVDPSHVDIKSIHCELERQKVRYE